VNKACDCGQEIMFLKTPAGSSMPVDVPPARVVLDSQGPLNVVLRNGATSRARLPREDDVEVTDGFTSHFATCEDPDRYRRRKRATAR
jgi:hypothetical protein